ECAEVEASVISSAPVLASLLKYDLSVGIGDHDGQWSRLRHEGQLHGAGCRVRIHPGIRQVEPLEGLGCIGLRRRDALGYGLLVRRLFRTIRAAERLISRKLGPAREGDRPYLVAVAPCKFDPNLIARPVMAHGETQCAVVRNLEFIDLPDDVAA